MNTSLEDPTGSLKDVVIRPNPSNGTFELVLPQSFVGSWSWTIRDITSRIVKTGKANTGAQTLVCTECAAGIYFLHLRSVDGQEVNLRVVIR